MSRMFFQMMVSLDGFIAGPHGELDWHQVDDDFSRYVDAMLRSIDTILLGRVTYQELATYWPTATEPEAGRMNELRKVVVSRTLRDLQDPADPRRPAWANSELAPAGELRDVVADLKRRSPRGVGLFGSSTLAAHCLAQGLIDEIRLLVCPVLLGAGKPLFPIGPAGAARRALRLTHSEAFGSGTMYLTYAPVPAQR